MLRTKYGVSPWIDQFSRRRRLEFARFKGSATTDAIIVGGGLAGCMTTYALAAAGVKVVLLEADRLGTGGGGRSPGVLRDEPTASYRELESRHGRKAARAIFAASRRAVLDLASTARRLGIKGIDTADALRIVTRFGGDEKRHERETAARRDAGLDAVLLKGAAAARESAAENVIAGARLHDWGQSNPYRLIAGFAAAAIARGAVLHERSAVRRIKVRRKQVEVYTAGGSLSAETVIVCTGEPTDLFRPLKRHVDLLERYVVLTAALPAAIRKQIAARTPLVTDIEDPPHVIRRTEDDRLLIAGADQPRTPPRGRDKVVVQRTGQLMYELSRLYPAISGVVPEYGWELPIAATADGVMYAGPHRNYPRHLFAWATGHDPAQAFLASRILLRHVLGQTDRDDAYFAFTRG